VHALTQKALDAAADNISAVNATYQAKHAGEKDKAERAVQALALMLAKRRGDMGAVLQTALAAVCVFILLYMCHHTAIYASSYCYIYVLILLYMCPHTAIHVYSYCYNVSSYCYICVLILQVHDLRVKEFRERIAGFTGTQGQVC
jgi:4-hydroxybenzoate polyprenyltransferase